MRARTVMLALSGALLTASPAQAQTFDFETTPIGTTSPFSVTSGGLTATFSSFDVDAFHVGTLPPDLHIHGLIGHALGDEDPAPHTLLIAFSAPLSSMSFNFELDNGFGGAWTIFLSAFNGAMPVGSTSALGTPAPDGVFPEGVLTFAGGPFDSVALSSSEIDFGVDDIVVQQVAVTTTPEPATLAMVLPGVALVGAVVRRRRP